MNIYRFASLDDYLMARPLHVDGLTHDGWGIPYAIKARQLDATILFADISNFSGRTLAMSPTETLAFVNHFFSWITVRALTNTSGIVDKYIGDEVMIVFSAEFGSRDPFAEALDVARRFGEEDTFSFRPHMGIASGVVVVGYVGTPVKYNCSVFGHAVAVAARCASVRTSTADVAASIVFPASEWVGRDFTKLFPTAADAGTPHSRAPTWQISQPYLEHLKNMQPLEVISIANFTKSAPTVTAEQWARNAAGGLTFRTDPAALKDGVFRNR